MNKRYLILAVAVLVLAAFAIPAAFAASTDNPAKTWFDQMFAAKKAYVDQAVKNGQLTSEQGEAYKAHIDQMSQLRQQNNYSCPFGGPGLGRGFARGGGWCGGAGAGFGPGAMGGVRGQQAPSASTQQ